MVVLHNKKVVDLHNEKVMVLQGRALLSSYPALRQAECASCSQNALKVGRTRLRQAECAKGRQNVPQ